MKSRLRQVHDPAGEPAREHVTTVAFIIWAKCGATAQVAEATRPIRLEMAPIAFHQENEKEPEPITSTGPTGVRTGLPSSPPLQDPCRRVPASPVASRT